MPLAPALSPYGREDGEWLFGDAGREGSVRSDSRLSMADKWAGVPVGRSERERARSSFSGVVAAAHGIFSFILCVWCFLHAFVPQPTHETQ